MASDLKFEIFASQLFGMYWYRTGFLSEEPSISSLYPEEYDLDPENADIYEPSHEVAIYVINMFYSCIFEDELSKLNAQFEASPSHISDYIFRTCGRDGLFLGDLTVFELLLTSCTFVINLCIACMMNLNYKDVISYAHLCWAMYFEEYKKEFYDQGGWNQLKIVSLSYIQTRDFLSTYRTPLFLPNENRRDFILNIMKTVDNYKTFVNRIPANCKTVSKAWVKHHLQNFNKSDDSIVTIDKTERQDTRNPKVMRNFLLKLRHLCDPNTLDDKAQPKFVNSLKQYTKEASLGLLNLNNLTLNDTTASQKSDIEVKEIELPLQITDDQTDSLIEADLSPSKKDDQKLIGVDLLQHQDATSSVIENDTARNNPFLKLKMISSDDFPGNGTQGTSKQKQNEETKEIGLERERPEVKSLLKAILSLGNPEGMIHLQSSLPRSDANKSKISKKK
ncbi:uncharacterized protein TNIN_115881 [Trichonephila inaurata madagascariensis]|uniref:Uncharacterized protein n=1 Tax=Trichonephila inaurata madagascariensis TaxID=2747483 RepID=A0A8X6Y2U2_9ARAC|nr:uncharacterized protein TNIN_115881 [Trichonephila inaurata madagascariensis]